MDTEYFPYESNIMFPLITYFLEYAILIEILFSTQDMQKKILVQLSDILPFRCFFIATFSTEPVSCCLLSSYGSYSTLTRHTPHATHHTPQPMPYSDKDATPRGTCWVCGERTKNPEAKQHKKCRKNQRKKIQKLNNVGRLEELERGHKPISSKTSTTTTTTTTITRSSFVGHREICIVVSLILFVVILVFSSASREINTSSLAETQGATTKKNWTDHTKKTETSGTTTKSADDKLETSTDTSSNPENDDAGAGAGDDGDDDAANQAGVDSPDTDQKQGEEQAHDTSDAKEDTMPPSNDASSDAHTGEIGLTPTQFRVDVRNTETVVGAKAGWHEVIDIKNEATQAYEAGFMCKTFDLKELLGDNFQVDSHIIRIEPVLTKDPNYGSIVHHMDIFACQHEAAVNIKLFKTRPAQSQFCAQDMFMKGRKYASCTQLIWAYDKGAEFFDFPKETGILLGPNCGFDTFMFQVHYLLPPNFKVGRDPPPVDSSGFRLTIDKTLRPNDSGLVGALDMTIMIPPHSTKDFKVTISAETLQALIGADLNKFGQVKPFAVHLHAHDYTIKVRLEHLRGKYPNMRVLKAYDAIVPFRGYGNDQTFRHLLTDVEPILSGDTLIFICTIRNTRNILIHYGVAHGDEMCAPLMLYYPHVRGPEGYASMNVN